MTPLLDIGSARVFFDGIFSDPRIAHPEGVAVHADGSIWCGTETGDLVRIEADASSASLVGSTGGFLLGIAFDRFGNVYACDLKHAAVFRYNASTGSFVRFADGGMLVPNYPVVDERRHALYVTDSRGNGNKGPGVFRFDLSSGAGSVWCAAPMNFANGCLLARDGNGLYVVQSDVPCVSYVPILDDGSAGPVRTAVEGVETVPDGLAYGPDGALYISCYEPSRIYRKRNGRSLELLIEDTKATTLAHPTNIALKGSTLYTANLGRWHITEVDLSTLKEDQ